MNRMEKLFIIQRINKLIQSNLDRSNQYLVKNENDSLVFKGEEEDDLSLSRLLLTSKRSFCINIHSTNGKRYLTLKKNFQWLKQEMEIFDARGVHIGSVKKRVLFLKRMFTVSDVTGKEIYQVVSFRWKPWLYIITNDQGCVGYIRKKLPKKIKVLIKGDNFLCLEFIEEIGLTDKCLLLGTVFLIDILCFGR